MGLFTQEFREDNCHHPNYWWKNGDMVYLWGQTTGHHYSFIISSEVQECFFFFFSPLQASVLKVGSLCEWTEAPLLWLVREDAKGIVSGPPDKSRKQTEAFVNISETHCTWTEDTADEKIVCFVVPSADLESHEHDKQPESVLFSLICWMALLALHELECGNVKSCRHCLKVEEWYITVLWSDMHEEVPDFYHLHGWFSLNCNNSAK